MSNSKGKWEQVTETWHPSNAIYHKMQYISQASPWTLSHEHFVLPWKIGASVFLPAYRCNYWDIYEYFIIILDMNYLHISWCMTFYGCSLKFNICAFLNFLHRCIFNQNNRGSIITDHFWTCFAILPTWNYATTWYVCTLKIRVPRPTPAASMVNLFWCSIDCVCFHSPAMNFVPVEPLH